MQLQIGSGEYGIAALTRIGLAYGDLAQELSMRLAARVPIALGGVGA